jgi:hypothetical protein
MTDNPTDKTRRRIADLEAKLAEAEATIGRLREHGRDLMRMLEDQLRSKQRLVLVEDPREWLIGDLEEIAALPKIGTDPDEIQDSLFEGRVCHEPGPGEGGAGECGKPAVSIGGKDGERDRCRRHDPHPVNPDRDLLDIRELTAAYAEAAKRLADERRQDWRLRHLRDPSEPTQAR